MGGEERGRGGRKRVVCVKKGRRECVGEGEEEGKREGKRGETR